jgi:hypothetical protein
MEALISIEYKAATRLISDCCLREFSLKLQVWTSASPLQNEMANLIVGLAKED